MEKIDFRVVNLATSYKKFSISKVSFSLVNGSIFGLVGRSGSGKSTIIKTLIGLKEKDFGSVRSFINNSEVDLHSIMGYSPQQNSLFPFLTLEENIYTFGEMKNVPKSTITKRIPFLLKRLDLVRARNKRIIELSGGMQKRADLAVAFIHDPKILILDEPFAGLDISLQNFIWELLLDWAHEGRICIISSHMLEDLENYCTEFGLIHLEKFYNTAQIKATQKSLRTPSLSKLFIDLFTEELHEE